MLRVLEAKALPSVSQGQDMSTSKYFLSHAIHIDASRIYGTAPLRYLREKRNIVHISVICTALARIANTPPPRVALQTQKVVRAFQRTKQKRA